MEHYNAYCACLTECIIITRFDGKAIEFFSPLNKKITDFCKSKNGIYNGEYLFILLKSDNA